jgi:hypothetical protein
MDDISTFPLVFTLITTNLYRKNVSFVNLLFYLEL